MGLVDRIKEYYMPEQEKMKRVNIYLADIREMLKNENKKLTPEQIADAREKYDLVRHKYNLVNKEYDFLISNEMNPAKERHLENILYGKEMKLADAAMHLKAMLERPDEARRWQYCFDEDIVEVDYINGASLEEKKAAVGKISEIVDKISTNTKNQNLRFHATSLTNAVRIIDSKQLSSSADRYDGYNNSTDGYGRISVTEPKDLGYSVSYYFNLVLPNVPCGAIFVLEPREGQDFPEANQMSSVDFRKHPDQLKAIITTDENVKILQEKMERNGFNPFLVQTFERFYEQNKVKEPRQVLTQEMKDEMKHEEESKYIDEDKILSQENTVEPVITQRNQNFDIAK